MNSWNRSRQKSVSIKTQQRADFQKRRNIVINEKWRFETNNSVVGLKVWGHELVKVPWQLYQPNFKVPIAPKWNAKRKRNLWKSDTLTKQKNFCGIWAKTCQINLTLFCHVESWQRSQGIFGTKFSRWQWLQDELTAWRVLRRSEDSTKQRQCKWEFCKNWLLPAWQNDS